MNFENVKPLSQERLRGMMPSEIEAAELEFVEHVLQITERHCAAAGMEVTFKRRNVSFWYMVGIEIEQALVPHANVLRDPARLAFLRPLFAEIFDFLDYAYAGDPAYTIYELSRAFGSGIECGPILALLLPERAKPALAAAGKIAEAAYEEELRRQDQMGY